MPLEIIDQGHYELFETHDNNRVFSLNDSKWFAWDQGGVLVYTDANHRKARTLQTGQFYLVNFNNETGFKDMPYLFFQNVDQYQILMLPDGVPTEKELQKSTVKPAETISVDKLDRYLKQPLKTSSGEPLMEGPVGSSIVNVTRYLDGIAFPTNKKEIVAHARRNKPTFDILEKLENIENRQYSNIDEIINAIEKAYTGKDKESKQLPIQNYDQMSTDEIISNLTNKSPEDLQVLRDHESEHKKRISLLDEFDRRLVQTKGAGAK
jgi:hypothetical protein